MTTIGYIRVSTDHQDLEKQRHLLLEYSQQQKLIIDELGYLPFSCVNAR